MRATLIGLVFLLGVAGCGTRQAPLATRQDRFINVIRVLADSGRLTDRQEVERLLGTKLILKKAYESQSPFGECERNSNSGRMYSSASYEADPKFWFKNNSDGNYPGLAVPNRMLREASQEEKPSFSYTLEEEKLCFDNKISAPKVSVRLSFINIPVLYCITKLDLKLALPQVKDVTATDFAEPYSYDGPQRDTSVTFSFTFGNACMLSVSLDQSLRVQRRRAEHS